MSEASGNDLLQRAKQAGVLTMPEMADLVRFLMKENEMLEERVVELRSRYIEVSTRAPRSPWWRNWFRA